MNRKEFLRHVGMATAVLGASSAAPKSAVAEVAPDPGGALNLRDYGAVGDGVADDGPALQRAFDALATVGGGQLVIPPGRFRITSPASKDFNNAASAVRIVGYGSASQFVMKTAASATAIALHNLQHLTLEGVTFVGDPSARSDAGVVLLLSYCDAATVRDCNFYGLGCFDASDAAIIRTNNTNLAIERSSFRGSVAGNGVIVAQNWTGFRAEDCLFIDHGVLNGTYVSKTNVGQPNAWIVALTPSTYPLNSAVGQGVLTVRNSALDEGAVAAIQVNPSGGRVTRVHIDGVDVNCASNGVGLDLRAIDSSVIENSFFGYTSVGDPLDAIRLMDVREALVSRVICAQLANRITADAACGTLLVDESTFASLNSSAARTKVRKDGRGAVAMIKEGPVSDADFPAPPPDGTLAVDTVGLSLYVRAGDVWTAASLTSTPMTNTTPPAAPMGLTATTVTATQIDLRWDANPAGDEVVRYVVERDGTVVAETTTASFSDRSVSAGTRYVYKVYAVDSTGNRSSPSDQLSVDTPASPDSGREYVLSFTPANLRRDFSGWVGMRFTVGSAGLRVSALGRWVVSGNSRTHLVKLVDGTTGSDLPGGSATIATAAAPPDAFHYARLSNPVMLAPNTPYYLVSEEAAGGDVWYDYDTRLATTQVALHTGLVYAYISTPRNWVAGGGAGNSYGPLNFLYTIA